MLVDYEKEALKDEIKLARLVAAILLPANVYFLALFFYNHLY